MPIRRTISIGIEGDMCAALERFMTDMGVHISEAEAVQAALREWAMTRGYLPAQIEQDNKEGRSE